MPSAIEADFEREPHRHGVEGVRERFGQRHRPEILAAVVLRLPALDGDGAIVAHRLRREAAFERREVDERLERGAGLAPRRDRAVELALAVVLAADQRAHRAVRAHHHHGALLDRELLALLGELLGERFFGRGLQRAID